MAGIFERKTASGNIKVRVVLRHKGFPRFNLTFDDWYAACLWVERHEDAYHEDPESYFRWRQSNYSEMRRNRERVRDHIAVPRFRKS